jgi:glyoxylase-like metal-dependent hydrolase (beta-lactamase superfamily II)
MAMQWEQISEEIWVFRESCNVFALIGDKGAVLINAGTGYALDHLNELPVPVVALLCTHFLRDHSAGAAKAAKRGIPVWVPEGEHAIFSDPNQHFRQRETYIIYDNLWDLYAPLESCPISGVLQDYLSVTFAGRTLEVIPLPGVTMHQVGLGVTLRDGRAVVFSAEAIYAGGKLARVAPLQYNYNDLPGAVQCYLSAQTLQKRQPDALYPSLGNPIEAGVQDALALLQTNLKHLTSPRFGFEENYKRLETPALQQVTEHVWQDMHSVANTWYLVSKSGKVMAIDYGYHLATCMAWSGYPKPERRRSLLHGLEELQQTLGIDRIDVVLVSHFHDDHVCGIPTLQRVFGTECWAGANFADLLAYPESHCFPCDWHIPAKIDRRLALDEPFHWEEYTFHLAPMNGHTRFAALIGFEADGKRFAHTGDQYFFSDVSNFSVAHRNQNHVYRNGATLDGYDLSAEWMLCWRPDIVLQGHQPPMHTDSAFFKHIEAWREDYAETHRRIMPLGDSEAHFDMDSWGGWITPYRTVRPTVEPFSVQVTVRNPFPHPTTLQVRLIGVEGWSGEATEIEAEARAEVSCTLQMSPNTEARRQPIAVELCAEGRTFGLVAEALVTLGHSEF